MNHPFGVLEPALQGAAPWCDLLILHLNVKNCGVSGSAPGELLALTLGRKVEQAADDGYRLEFRFRVAAAAQDYLRVQMNADAGPLGTRDYRLAFEAAPLDAARSVVHLSYAYAYGLAARMATQTYLSTLGRGKVGFSVASTGADGKPVYVDGVRGVLERNTMRYYLAIEGLPRRARRARRAAAGEAPARLVRRDRALPAATARAERRRVPRDEAPRAAAPARRGCGCGRQGRLTADRPPESRPLRPRHGLSSDTPAAPGFGYFLDRTALPRPGPAP